MIGSGSKYSDCISPFDVETTKQKLEEMFPGMRIRVKSGKKDVVVKVKDVLELNIDVFDEDAIKKSA